MNKKMVLIVTLILVTTLSMGVFAEIDFSAFEWTPPEETATITYYAGSDLPETNTKTMEVMHDLLLKYFNIDMQRIVYENDREERLAMMAASNNYPDVIVCMNPSQAADWYAQGRAIDMKPYIDEYAPNFVEALGDLYKRFVTEDGKMYALPNIWGMMTIADYAAQIRNDWWVDAGKPEITNPDSYFEALQTLVKMHPENSNGDKTYALGFIKGRKSYELTGAMWGLKQGWKVDENNTLQFFPGTEEGWEITKYLNRFNLAGLLDPDSFVMTMDEWVQKLAVERYAGHLDAWWPIVYTQTYWPESVKDYNPETDLYVHMDVHIDSLEASTMNPKNANGTFRTIVTDKCKNPELIAKFINFEHSEMGKKLLGWGVPSNYEGIVKGAENDYGVWRQTEEEPGWAFNEEYIDQILTNSFNATRHSYMGGSTATSFTFDQRYQADGTSGWYDQNFNDRIWWRDFMNTNLAPSMFDWSAFLAIQVPADEDISMQWQQIKDVVTSMYIEAVLADSEEACKAKYDEMVQKVTALGMDEVNTWFTEQYQMKLKAWGIIE